MVISIFHSTGTRTEFATAIYNISRRTQYNIVSWFYFFLHTHLYNRCAILTILPTLYYISIYLHISTSQYFAIYVEYHFHVNRIQARFLMTPGVPFSMGQGEGSTTSDSFSLLSSLCTFFMPSYGGKVSMSFAATALYSNTKICGLQMMIWTNGCLSVSRE